MTKAILLQAGFTTIYLTSGQLRPRRAQDCKERQAEISRRIRLAVIGACQTSLASSTNCVWRRRSASQTDRIDSWSQAFRESAGEEESRHSLVGKVKFRTLPEMTV